MHTILWQSIPPRGTLRWWRGNLCGIRLPDLPSVAGGALDSSLVLSWFLDRYAFSDQDRIIRKTLEDGYDRITLSWPDSAAFGQSIAQYVDTSNRLIRAGLLVDHHFFSKVYDGLNPDPATAYPVIDALLAADAISLGTVGWELNAFNDPGPTFQRLIDGVCGRIHAGNPAIPVYLHFLPHYASWQANTESPHDFWMRQVGKIQGLKYQADPGWDAGMIQARTNDVLVRLCPNGLWGTPGFDVVAWETTAQTQFNGEMAEDRGDLQSYQQLCTLGPMPVMGYGNGCRRPDGTAL